MRIRDPKTTALIFASGKMVVTGAKSEDDSKLASRKYARIIQKLGFPAKFTDFKIQNIVGSCDVKFPIRLEGLAYSHGHFSSVSRHWLAFICCLRSPHWPSFHHYSMNLNCFRVLSTVWWSLRSSCLSSFLERLCWLVPRWERKSIKLSKPSTQYCRNSANHEESNPSLHAFHYFVGSIQLVQFINLLPLFFFYFFLPLFPLLFYPNTKNAYQHTTIQPNFKTILVN